MRNTNIVVKWIGTGFRYFFVEPLVDSTNSLELFRNRVRVKGFTAKDYSKIFVLFHGLDVGLQEGLVESNGCKIELKRVSIERNPVVNVVIGLLNRWCAHWIVPLL